MTNPWERDLVQEEPKQGAMPWEADLVSEGGPAALNKKQKKDAKRWEKVIDGDGLSPAAQQMLNQPGIKRQIAERYASRGVKPPKKMSRGMAAMSNFANTATFGTGDYINSALGAGLEAATSDKSFGDAYNENLATMRDTRKTARRDRIGYSTLGDVIGFGAGGYGAYKATGQALARAPGAAFVADKVGKAGRLPAWFGRLGGESAKWAGASAAYGFGPGTSNVEAEQGRTLGVGGRAGVAKDYGLSPINLAPFGLSAINRAAIGVKSALGTSRPATVTPNAVQAEAAAKWGRAPVDEKSVVLDAARKQFGVSESSIKGLDRILTQSGYSSDDIAAGIRDVLQRANVANQRGERIGLFATELQKQFDLAAQNIEDVSQQLFTASPRQGKTSAMGYGAIDEQYASQADDLQRIAKQKLGSSTVLDDQVAIAERRAQIGAERDRTITYAATDARGRGLRKQMQQWVDDLRDDPEVFKSLRAAARQLGYAGRNEVDDALRDTPALLMQKFGEISGAQIRSPAGASPVLKQARMESEALFDELSRFGRNADNAGFAPKDTGTVGPYKRAQQGFSETYSQDEAIDVARRNFSKVQDPLQADAFVQWYKGLPEIEQQLVKTVVRQDMEAMLRGGSVDGLGAHLTQLKKNGVHDVLIKLFGKDGEDLSNAIRQIADEQEMLKKLDPRQGLQRRVVKKESKGYRDALDLYSTGIGGHIVRAGNKISPRSNIDLAMMAGQLSSGMLPVPWMTVTKQAAKMFRPRTKTREGLAQLLTMRPGAALPKPSTPPPVPMGPPAIIPQGPSAPQTSPTPPHAPLPPTRNPITKGIRATQRRLAKPNDPRFATDRLPATRPERIEPGRSYFEQLPADARADAAAKIGQIHARGGANSERIASYIRDQGRKIESVKALEGQAKDAQQRLAAAQKEYTDASREFTRLSGIARDSKSPLLQVEFRQAHARLEAAEKALRHAESVPIPKVPRQTTPDEMDGFARMLAETGRANKNPNVDPLQGPRSKARDKEMLDLMLRPERAEDAMRISVNRPQFDSFKNTGRVTAGVGGLGYLGGTSYGIGRMVQSAEDNQPKKPPLNGPKLMEVQDTLRTLGYDIEVDGYWGPNTIEAIKQYQRDNGMRVNGKWSNAMHNYLRRDKKKIDEMRYE